MSRAGRRRRYYRQMGRDRYYNRRHDSQQYSTGDSYLDQIGYTPTSRDYTGGPYNPDEMWGSHYYGSQYIPTDEWNQDPGQISWQGQPSLEDYEDLYDWQDDQYTPVPGDVLGMFLQSDLGPVDVAKWAGAYGAYIDPYDITKQKFLEKEYDVARGALKEQGIPISEGIRSGVGRTGFTCGYAGGIEKDYYKKLGLDSQLLDLSEIKGVSSLHRDYQQNLFSQISYLASRGAFSNLDLFLLPEYQWSGYDGPTPGDSTGGGGGGSGLPGGSGLFYQDIATACNNNPDCMDELTDMAMENSGANQGMPFDWTPQGAWDWQSPYVPPIQSISGDVADEDIQPQDGMSLLQGITGGVTDLIGANVGGVLSDASPDRTYNWSERKALAMGFGVQFDSDGKIAGDAKGGFYPASITQALSKELMGELPMAMRPVVENVIELSSEEGKAQTQGQTLLDVAQMFLGAATPGMSNPLGGMVGQMFLGMFDQGGVFGPDVPTEEETGVEGGEGGGFDESEWDETLDPEGEVCVEADPNGVCTDEDPEGDEYDDQDYEGDTEEDFDESEGLDEPEEEIWEDIPSEEQEQEQEGEEQEEYDQFDEDWDEWTDQDMEQEEEEAEYDDFTDEQEMEEEEQQWDWEDLEEDWEDLEDDDEEWDPQDENVEYLS